MRERSTSKTPDGSQVDGYKAMMPYLAGVLGPALRDGLPLNDATPTLRRRLDRLQSDFSEFDRDGGGEDRTESSRRRPLVQSVNAETPFDAFIDRARHFLDLSVADTEQMLKLALRGPSGEAVSPGVHFQPINAGPRRADRSASIVWVAANASIPRHRHLGDEWGLMLQGRIIDDLDNDHAAGEYFLSRADTDHTVRNPGVEMAIFLNLIEAGYQW